MKASLLVNNGGEDRLSSLPNFILYEILSRLPIKTAATTSLLSHHWRYHWTHITHISLHYLDVIAFASGYGKYQDFTTTIDHILAQLLVPSLKLHSFFFCSHGAFAGVPAQLPSLSRLQSWLPLVCSRNPDLISIETTNNIFGFMPACVFQTRSLVELKLDCGPRTTYEFPDNGTVNLPNLKKLKVRNIGDSNTRLVTTLFKSCPLLEVLDVGLRFALNDHVVEISSPHLKSLLVDLAWCNRHKILIDAPKLEYLWFTGRFPLYCFVETPTALRVAELDFSLPSFDEAKEGLSSLLRGISCVKSLVLWKTTLCALNRYDATNAALSSFFRKLTRVEVYNQLQKIMNAPRKTALKKFRRIEIEMTDCSLKSSCCW